MAVREFAEIIVGSANKKIDDFGEGGSKVKDKPDGINGQEDEQNREELANDPVQT